MPIAFHNTRCGGTRAAALSYGVMQELRDTFVMSDGKEVRLLLRHEPPFKAYKQANSARMSPGAMQEEQICEFFLHPKCAEAALE